MSLYSIVIATHRRAEWLQRAVMSIKAQTFKSIDIVIVSDAMCDETARLVLPLLESTDLFVQRWGVPGPADSRNIGIRLLSSDYALFLDDDDELPPDFVETMHAVRPGDYRGILYSDFVFHIHRQTGAGPEQVTVQHHSLAGKAASDVYVRNFIPNSCLVYPVEILKSRRFDPSLILNEDWDFILNAMGGAALAHVPVSGPVIHKTEAPRRGNSNAERLLESYLSIYGKWPAPTQDLKLARQSLLAQTGVNVPSSSL